MVFQLLQLINSTSRGTVKLNKRLNLLSHLYRILSFSIQIKTKYAKNSCELRIIKLK